MSRKLILRAETKPGERRTPLTPEGVVLLRHAGVVVEVESSDTRIYADSAYREAGAVVVAPGMWRFAEAEDLVLGLKELPAEAGAIPLSQRHSYFAHCFRGQSHAVPLLRRFREDGGELFDLEYLVDAEGRRIAAFGYWAGFVGAAVAVLAWAAQSESGRTLDGPLRPWRNSHELVEEVRRAVGASSPRAGVTGHLGRAGQGAIALLERTGLTWRGWDQAECADGGTIPEMLEVDLLVHCVGSDRPRSPFLTAEEVAKNSRRLCVLSDVTCDQGSPHHLFPFYRSETTLVAPVLRLFSDPPLDLIAIDHLPTLLPRESSDEFSARLVPHLVAFLAGRERSGERSTDPWLRAQQRFSVAVQSLEEL